MDIILAMYPVFSRLPRNTRIILKKINKHMNAYIFVFSKKEAKDYIVHAYRRHKIFNSLLVSIPRQFCCSILNETFSNEYTWNSITSINTNQKACWLLYHKKLPQFSMKCRQGTYWFLNRIQDILCNVLIFYKKGSVNKTLEFSVDSQIIISCDLPNNVEQARINMRSFPRIKVALQELRISGSGITQIIQTGHILPCEERRALVKDPVDLSKNMTIDLFGEKWQNLHYAESCPLKFVKKTSPRAGWYLERSAAPLEPTTFNKSRSKERVAKPPPPVVRFG